jgi:hypothetical protein
MRLLTLPVTIARVPLEFGFEVVKRVAGFAYGVVAPGEEEDRVDFATQTEPAPAGNGRPPEAEVAEPAEPAPAQPAAAEAAPVEPVEPEPAHVSEEPELVAEVAEEGAEDGAGPEIEIDEPWPGYDRMNASDIKDRLVAEGAEAAAAVRLYEASRKGRASVLEAASRNLRE